MTPRECKMLYIRNHPELLREPAVKGRQRKTA